MSIDLLVLNLVEDSEEDLKEGIKDIENALRKRQQYRDFALFWEATLTGEETLIGIGVAMMRSLWKMPMEELLKELKKAGTKLAVEPDRLGYFLAEKCRVYIKPFGEPFFQDEDLENLRKKMLRRFDATDYVWANTHYDECDNGFFFRRS